MLEDLKSTHILLKWLVLHMLMEIECMQVVQQVQHDMLKRVIQMKQFWLPILTELLQRLQEVKLL